MTAWEGTDHQEGSVPALGGYRPPGGGCDGLGGYRPPGGFCAGPGRVQTTRRGL